MLRGLFGVFACLVSTACAPSVLARATLIPAYSAGYAASEGEEMAGAVADLEARLRSWGVTIETLQPSDAAVGRALVAGGPRTIYLRPNMSANARLEVLSHEGAHLFQSPALEDRSTAEMFAELTSVGVCRFYGRDTREIAAKYLAGFKSGFPAYEYLKRDIETAIKALTGQGPLPEHWLR